VASQEDRKFTLTLIPKVNQKVVSVGLSYKMPPFNILRRFKNFKSIVFW